jgi:hypothetical protein
MQGRFEKDEPVFVKSGIRLPFRSPRRIGIVRFAYDHDPPAYDVEFFWYGESVGVHYFADEELNPVILPDFPVDSN